MESNRREVVSLLLSLVSAALYSPLSMPARPPVRPAPIHSAECPARCAAEECETTRNTFLVHLATAEHPRAGALACSLLNTALTYDPVGYGIPYSHLFHDDHAQRLAAASLQLLLVLLDYTEPPDAPGQGQGQAPGEQDQDHPHANIFIRRLRAMTMDDMAFVLGHITRVLLPLCLRLASLQS
jgi:hypothetical protein